MSLGPVYLKDVSSVLPDVKGQTEKWMGKFLNAPVHVEKMEVNVLHHFSLTGIEIEPKNSQLPILIDVRQIRVKYDVLGLIQRRFQVPSQIFLERPELSFDSFKTKEKFLDTRLLDSSRGLSTRLLIEDGRVELPWFGVQKKLLLTNIWGKAVPFHGFVFQLKFRGMFEGSASGFVSSEGELDIARKKIKLAITFHHVSFTSDAGVPVQDLNGTVVWDNESIQIKELKFKVRGVPVRLSGSISSVNAPDLVMILDWEVQNSALPVRGTLNTDFKRGLFRGSIGLTGREATAFSGVIHGSPKQFEITHLKLGNLYHGTASVNFPRGDFQMKIRNRNQKNQRGKFTLSLSGFSGRMEIELHHFKVFGFQVVTYGVLDFEPDEKSWEKGDFAFLVHVGTDYLIFEGQLLKDFYGSALVNATSLESIVARWGSLSELRGKISFAENNPALDLKWNVGPFPLGQLKQFGVYRMPRTCLGTFESIVNLHGDIHNPTWDGKITIEQGVIDRLKFDRALIQFSGHAPYFPLFDSKVWKGRHALNLEGGFDFKLKNFLKAVKVVNSEHVVIWKGLELSRDFDDFSPAGESLASASVSSMGQVAAFEGLQVVNQKVGKVEMEYHLNERASLHAAVEKDQSNQEYVAAGPKVKF